MRIACLQLASRVGEVAENTKKADAMLDGADPDELRDLDLLVLPELALTGYNFQSLQHISPYLETAGLGSTATWAKSRAQAHGCSVVAGYPEEVRPSSPEGNHGAYNAAIIVDKSGSTVGNYRKSFLYYTDDTWAQEGDGFFQGELPGLGRVAVGICMDINPYKFEAPWEACEFGTHVVRVHANLVVVVMAWLTHTPEAEFLQEPGAPDMETVDYWVQRFQPVLDAMADGQHEDEVLNEEVIVVCANRCGVEGNVVYAGTSTVMGITGTEIRVYGILGRGVESLLVVDTAEPPRMRLVRARREGDRDQ